MGGGAHDVGSAWLYQKKRWRAEDFVWSISRTHKKLDRVGKATNQSFDIMPHTQLVDLVRFDLTENNKCKAAGRIWVRTGCIPMGGPFSAQAAGLHSLWPAFQKNHLFRALGSLVVSDAGYPTGWGSIQ